MQAGMASERREMLDLRVVLVDDERLARDELSFLVEQLEGVEIVGQAGDGVDALTTIERLRPDVVFLDIQMPGLTGFEVARRLIDSGHPTEIIFVTAFDQHAIEAFEINAVDYLLKPVDPPRLEVAIQRARKRLTYDRENQRQGTMATGGTGGDSGGIPSAGGIINEQLERIVQIMAERKNRRDQLAIKVDERFILVHAEEIVYASMVDDAITVATGQQTGASSFRTLDELHARLDPDVFWRVHRAHLVNINKIREIVPWFSRNYLLRMKDAKATEIPVSRSQTRRLREYLKL
jgi:two-component system LytT family response regulator/two-component system response regulator LytT